MHVFLRHRPSLTCAALHTQHNHKLIIVSTFFSDSAVWLQEGETSGYLRHMATVCTHRRWQNASATKNNLLLLLEIKLRLSGVLVFGFLVFEDLRVRLRNLPKKKKERGTSWQSDHIWAQFPRHMYILWTVLLVSVVFWWCLAPDLQTAQQQNKESSASATGPHNRHEM